MAHYFLFPEKDTTIYSKTTLQAANASIDETLTLLNEEFLGDRYPSRILIQFKNSEVNNTITNLVSGPFSASLKLWATEHSNLSLDQHFEVYPVAQQWYQGTGRITNDPLTLDGVSWRYRSSGSIDSWATDNFNTGITASYTITPYTAGGGSWYTGSGFEVTKSYSYNEELDLSFDLTSPVTKHYSSSYFSSTYPEGIPNYGFILKRSSSQEFNSTTQGVLNFFSMDTHTIYPPYLDISWDDSSYDTGSATDNTILKTGEIFVTLRNNKAEYRTIEEPKFRLNVRELYPTRRFVTSSNYLDVKYFTSESYYSLIDYATEETIIPFDEHTKLSADSQGMYFKLYMNGLQEERYYKLIFKHKNDDGITVYDENYFFKVNKS